MAAIDFPSSPATNDTFNSAGRTWLYNGTAWTLLTLTQTVIPANSVTSSSIVNDSIVNAPSKPIDPPCEIRIPC